MSDLQSLKLKRARTEASICRIRDYVANITENSDLIDITTRLSRLKDMWIEFCTHDDEITLIPNQSSNSEVVEELYLKLEADLRRHIRARTNATQARSQQSQPQLNETINTLTEQHKTLLNVLAEQHTHQPAELKLPRLTIPFFDGNYSEWPSFQDLFVTSVHENSALSKVQKFQYLKGLIKGDAALQIRHIMVTEQNYDSAWTKLVERYDRKKQIVNDFIKTFIEQPYNNKPSSSSLRRLADTSDEIIRGLQSLGDEAKSRDPWIIYILLQKLDAETKQLWAQHTADKDFSSVNDLIKFINNRCDALEAYNTNDIQKSSYASKLQTVGNKSTLLVSSSVKCPKCSGNHLLFKCTRFKALDISARRKFVSYHNLCFNCLSNGHQTSSCNSNFRCHYCNERHHSSLHQSTVQSHHSTTTVRRSNTPPNANRSIRHKNSINNNSTSLCSPSSRNISEITVSSLNPNAISYTSHHNRCSNNEGNTCQEVNHHQQGLYASHSTSATGTSHASHSTNNRQHISPSGNPSSSVNTSDPNLHCHQSNHQLEQGRTSTILPTAIIFIRDIQGVLQPCRALLDSATMATFITESCMQRLELKRSNKRVLVNGLSSVGVATTRGEELLQCVPEDGPSLEMRALVLSKITSSMPPTNIPIESWPWLHQLKLADPCFHKSGNIDILIGADYFFKVLKDGQLQGQPGAPLIQNTIFGWMIAGQHSQTTDNQQQITSFQLCIECDIDKSLRRFWELENLSDTSPHLTEDEIFCEEHFKTHTSISPEGRLVVRLPFKDSTHKLGNSLRTAIHCLLSLEKRLMRDFHLHSEYNSFITEYINLGHMKEIPEHLRQVEDHQNFYMPHHAVIKESSSTTKLRVVFNASRKTTSNLSLNDILAVGPTIQRDLFALLLHFRSNKVAISADIIKMYRQIQVDPCDWNFQRIVWRRAPFEKIKDFWLTTVTYGTASAPFLATRALAEIAKECEQDRPDLTHIIKNQFYVDDLLSGTRNVEEAITLRDDLEKALANRGFALHKWKSNAHEFMNSVPTNKRDTGCMNFDDNSTKILGLYWNPASDSFLFNTSLDLDGLITKRTILSQSSKIFDPLGLLAPATILLKILYQSLWLQKIGWDDPVPEHLAQQWQLFKGEFNQFESINVPRWLYSTDLNTCQFHGFSDASETAYAAVIYCRSIQGSKITINIIAAKTKVAPINNQSIPRLELCGALLLARLFNSVLAAFDSPATKCFAWTDSNIVISWLASHSKRWKTFIANRTSEILSILPSTHWKHVNSSDNPADIASRGVSPLVLKTSSLWWTGPQWLRQPETTWPTQISPQNNRLADLEERSVKIHNLHTHVPRRAWDHLINSISSFRKIIRIVAIWRRYFSHLKHKVHIRQGKSINQPSYNCFLSTKELSDSTIACLLWVQSNTFANEINRLKATKELPSKSKILALSPFLDPAGLLRVGGRIQDSLCNYNSKHPIILPKNHPITALIIHEFHVQYLHPGPTLLLSIIRQKYWVIGGRNTIRQYTHKCLSCFRQRRSAQQQFMGNLPELRVQPSRPFLHCGVDYAGPIRLRLNKRRGAKIDKGYIALFVCFSTKAIHLELVSDLTTDTFIAALKRFTARRGAPAIIHSDNATNFVRAKRKLSELYKLVLSKGHNDIVTSFLSQMQTTWKFIPPASPHFGGIWEAGVKSVKAQLKRVIGDTPLTFEELATLLTQIEGVLNSRPLTAISDSDVDNLNILTPGHFLVGTALTSLPDEDFRDKNPSLLKRWQQVQRMTQLFWKVWSKQYLHSLNHRPKWRHKTTNIAVNDIVLIHEDNLPPSVWNLGRVTDTHPGRDSLVRTATVKTKQGELKRPITKLSKLPID